MKDSILKSSFRQLSFPLPLSEAIAIHKTSECRFQYMFDTFGVKYLYCERHPEFLCQISNEWEVD